MKGRTVDNAPLLFLARLKRLELFRLEVDQVLVPSAVLSELRQMPEPALRQIEAALENWLEECTGIDPTILTALPPLGTGEREVIGQAIERTIESVVLDDM